MRIEKLKFSHGNRAPYNPRQDLKPGEPEWLDIEKSLEEFGQVVTMVYNERTGNYVAGHQRMRVMEHRGIEEAFFTVVDVDLATEKRMNIALNKVSGRWEPIKLQSLLSEMKAAELDLTRLGFTPIELNRILGTTPRRTNRDPDAAAPNLPAIPRTQPGDLYELISSHGAHHRLMCGDCRNPDTVAQLMDGTKARLIFTDPPYNVDYDNSTRGDGRRPLGHVQNDAMTPEGFAELLRASFANMNAHTMPNAALYTFLASATHIDFETALVATGWRVKQQIIWAKHFALSRADYHYAHEPVMYAVKQGENCEWFGPRTETTLWNTAPTDLEKLPKADLLAILLAIRETATIWHEPRVCGSEYVHPTQKPVGLAKRALINSSMPGEHVVDLYAGSGSTMVAAELNDRVACCMELEPGRCDVIVRRFLETFEGSGATRNGQPIQ